MPLKKERLEKLSKLKVGDWLILHPVAQREVGYETAQFQGIRKNDVIVKTRKGETYFVHGGYVEPIDPDLVEHEEEMTLDRE